MPNTRDLHKTFSLPRLARVRTVLLASVLALGLGTLCGAQEQTQRSFSTELSRTAELDYLLYLPDGYENSTSDWPLVLFLHGAGERGADLDLLLEHGPPKMLASGQDFPAIVVSPQCSPESFWTREVDTLLALLDDLENSYRIDPDRVYVTGLSMGGYGTWALTSAAPERFAAAAPICGGGSPIGARNLTQLPIWAFHGDRDSVVPLSESSIMVDAIRRFGGRHVRLTVYPDTGHDSWTDTYDDREFWQWLFAQRRGRLPPVNNPFGAAVAEEILESFMTAWNSASNEALRQVLHFPFLTFFSGNLVVNEEPQDFATDFDQLRSSGWERSAFDWDSLNVALTARSKIHASIRYTRYDQSDEVLSQGQVLYGFTFSDDRWGVHSRIGLPQDDLTEAERRKTVASSREALLDFFQAFNRSDADGSTSTLTLPHAFLLAPRNGSAGPIAIAQERSQAAPNFESMRSSQGWHNSSLDNFEPFHVSRKQVVWKVTFSRWRANGTRYLTVPALWISTLSDTGTWGLQIRSLLPPSFEDQVER